jgi:hypothetical protein
MVSGRGFIGKTGAIRVGKPRASVQRDRQEILATGEDILLTVGA